MPRKNGVFEVFSRFYLESRSNLGREFIFWIEFKRVNATIMTGNFRGLILSSGLMSHTMYRILVIAISTFAWNCTYGQASSRQDAPNIIVILADDLGWADVVHDSSRIDTPNLDRLAKEGMKLTSFYASAPMCSPTRAALLTGRYPHSVGMPDLAGPTKRNNIPVLSLDHKAITIPEALKPYGYKSMLSGKWHLGHHKENWPRAHGFDEFHGSLIGTPGYYDVKETYHNESPVKVSEYYTDAITGQALSFLAKEKGNPYFLYVAYNAPHYPLEAPAALVYKYRQRFPDKGLYAIYAAMVEQMDTGIGKILDALDSLGMDDNTFVVFSSDNGPTAEPLSYGLDGAKISAGPLREYKYSTHEGGIRVPFIARWPGRIPAGSVRNEVASTMDLLPTFLEACGIKPGKEHEIHGVSILPILLNKPFERKQALHWHNQFNMAVRKGNWKLVQQFFADKPYLYDMRADISEQHDLSARYPAVVQELQALHEEWLKKFYPNPIPNATQRSYYIFPREKD
jgi:arylsulfatase A-like enzyme